MAVENDYAAIGGLKGNVDIYSIASDKVERSLDLEEPVTDAIWSGAKIMFSTYNAHVKVYENGSEAQTFAEHAGAVTGLALHPGGNLLASVGTDKSYVFYDLTTLTRALRVYTDSCTSTTLLPLTCQMLIRAALTKCAFHPDGHLFATGTQDGDIKVFETKTGEQAAVFRLGAPIRSIVFSENGFWFAATGKGQTTVTIFDLRKEGDAAKVKELETGDAEALAWDYTGQYLATAGATGTTVQQYQKSSKKWSELLRSSLAGVAVQWGAEAKSLVTVNKDGVLSVLAVKQ